MNAPLLDLAGQLDVADIWGALVVSTLGTYATAVLGRQAAFAVDVRQRWRWLVTAVVAAAGAIWVDAYLTLLALPFAMVLKFTPLSLVGSFLIACVLLTIGAWTTLVRPFALANVVGGAVAGLSISAMQLVAMQGLHIPGTIVWDLPTIAFGMVFGFGFGAMSAVSWVRSNTRSPWIAIALFVVAITGSHLIAAVATTMSLDSTVLLEAGLIDDHLLTWIVCGASVVVVALAWLARSLNRRSRMRSVFERRQLQQLAEVAVEGLVICEGSRIVWVNRSLENMMPGSQHLLVGTSIETLLTIASLADVPHDREFDAQMLVDRTGLAPSVPVRIITREVDLRGRVHVVVAIRDQRARLRAEAEMQRLAESDALTGIPNRSRFNTVLGTLFATLAATGSRFAMMSLDLDRFKSVNDTHGHAAGDAVLVEVAARLSALLREGDLVARLGGDEFSILARTGNGAASVEALAARAIETLARPFVVDDRIHQIGVSIGIAFATSDGADPEALTRSADLALYRAKADGRGLYRTFEPGMRERMQERHVLEQALRHAIAHSEFRVFYQPQVDAVTGQFSGAEALLQWLHPTRGFVPPSDFIPVAEETNLIWSIGEWVLRTACAEAAVWPEPLVVAVNLSPVQFRDPNLVGVVASALAWTGLPGHRLELEITENVLIDDEARILAILAEFKALGIRLSLDDFGTGYSSLGRLHRFPFDRIKVDRTFVRGVPDDAGSVAIIRAVVALGVGLGMKTTAEGVETEAQRRFVTDAGCDQIQGFYFGEAVSGELLPEGFRVGEVLGVG